MRIAFYAPLKPPNHAVASGDREMARLLIKTLEYAGHTVDVASELRAFLPEPNAEELDSLQVRATDEIGQIENRWRDGLRPDLWFTYHPYYKSPDLLGPAFARRHNIPYVTAEASLSGRRNIGAWAQTQAIVAAGVRQAAVNICLTGRDRDGLAEIVPGARLERMLPFIEIPVMPATTHDGRRLACVAMMRAGDKFESYRMLAAALRRIDVLQWTLTIIGDGPAGAEVRRLFEGFDPKRVDFRGALPKADIPEILSACGVYVWPGCGEAYGLAYLEAQSTGLPVVAQASAGVPEVVVDGRTGILTAGGDVDAYAQAIARLLGDDAERQRLSDNARRFVRDERSLETAAHRLAEILPHTGHA
jgi:hypothetical protein